MSETSVVIQYGDDEEMAIAALLLALFGRRTSCPMCERQFTICACGDAVFEKFHGEKEGTLWYYRHW